MSRPIAPRPNAASLVEARAFRKLVKPAPTRLARFWTWLNTPLKG